MVFAVLVLVSTEDIKSRRIPMRFIVMLIIIWAAFALQTNMHCMEMLGCFLRGMIGALLIDLTSILASKITKSHALGGGDIKLFFVMGIYLAAEKLLYAAFLSCLFSVITIRLWSGTEKKKIPIGPSISCAFIIMLGLSF